MSKSWVAKQVARFRAGGYEAQVPQSKAPQRRPTQLDEELENEIVSIRKQLSEDGIPRSSRFVPRFFHQSITSPRDSPSVRF